MKIYLIGLYDEKGEKANVQSIVKAMTSYENAACYVISALEKAEKSGNYENFKCYQSMEKYEWCVSYRNKTGNNVEMFYRIEPIELEENAFTPQIAVPEIEKRLTAYEKENNRLKDEIVSRDGRISQLEGRIRDASTRLTFYDGGVYEDFDNLLDNIHKAKNILTNRE